MLSDFVNGEKSRYIGIKVISTPVFLAQHFSDEHHSVLDVNYEVPWEFEEVFN